MRSKILALVLALALCLALAACNNTPAASSQSSAASSESSAASSESSAASSESSAASSESSVASSESSVASSESSAASSQAASALVGSWRFYDTQSDDPDIAVTHEDVEKMKEQGFDAAGNQMIDLYENGTYLMYLFGDVAENTWTDNGGGTGSIIIEDTEYPTSTFNITVEGGLLCFHMPDNVTRFEPSAETAAQQPRATA